MSSYVKATNFATKDTLPQGDSNKIVKGTELDNEFNAIAGAISSKADIASPSFTGTPAAPTAVFGTNTTQLATTAFVTAALQAVYPVGSIYINATSTSNPSSIIGFGTWVEFGAGRVLVGQNTTDASFDVLEETGGSKDAIVVAHTHTGTTASSLGSHGHTFSGTSSAVSNDHTHAFSGTTSTTGEHQHDVRSVATGDLLQHVLAAGAKQHRIFDGSAAGIPESRFIAAPAGNHNHTYSGTTSGISANHTHTYSGTTATQDLAHTHTFTTASTGSSGANANLPPYIVVKMWKRTA
jgi:hypothetical protein